MITLKWTKVKNHWETNYKGYIIRTAIPQKWTRTFKKKIPYFKLVNPNTTTVEYDTNLDRLISNINKKISK